MTFRARRTEVSTSLSSWIGIKIGVNKLAAIIVKIGASLPSVLARAARDTSHIMNWGLNTWLKTTKASRGARSIRARRAVERVGSRVVTQVVTATDSKTVAPPSARAE